MTAGPIPPPPFSRDRLSRSWLLLKAGSDAGDTLWTLALAWTAVMVTSPAAAGLVVAAGAVPRAVLLLVGGALADRLDVVRVMVLANVGRVAVLVAVLAWTLTREPTLPVLVVAAVAFGVSDAFYEPAAGTLGRQLVRAEDLPAYAGLGQTLSRLGTMAGAATGGLLVAKGGLGASAAVNAATFAVVVMFLVGRMRLRYPLPRTAGESVVRSVRLGVGHLRRRPTAGTLVVSLMGLNLFVGPALALGLALRVEREGWSAGLLGVATALVGLGAAAGSLGVVRWRPRRDASVGFGWLVVQAAAIALLGLGPFWTTATAAFVVGVSAGVASTLLGALLSLTVDGEFLGRTSALLRWGDDVLMPGSMVLFGLLVTATSVGLALTLYGLAMGALVLRPLLNPRIRALSSREAVSVAAVPPDVG